jgi:glycosyltransferase involved in cell wall biosynthesis
MTRPTRLRIAQVAPPFEAVPPTGYGGTERVVAALIDELVRRGHDVSLFASGDSEVRCELIPTVPRAVRATGFSGDPAGFYASIGLQVLDQIGRFDVVHSHLDFAGLVMAARSPKPVVTTFHGRLDWPYAPSALELAGSPLVAISQAQAAVHPDIPWAGVVHNGLDLSAAPFERRRTDDLVFVGRITPEKGVLDAIEVARQSGRRLRIAAKIGPSAGERDYAETVFEPAMDGADVEFLGELSGRDRDRLLASSYALVMPGAWPEPFGLTAIEALACGTPVIARNVGALPEIVRPGIDGFLADDVAQMVYHLDGVASLDRSAIRADVLERFSATRMADGYEAVYAAALGLDGRSHDAEVIPLIAGA